MRRKSILVMCLFAPLVLSCSARTTVPTPRTELSLLSGELRANIRKVEKSIVGINTTIFYDVQTFNYDLRDGNYVADPLSPVKYKLRSENGNGGIVHEKDTKTLSGGGLIISVNPNGSSYAVITSSHLVSPPETTDVYYVDKQGDQTDILFRRYVVKDVKISLVGTGIWEARSRLIADDPITDLAIIKVQTTNNIGPPFSGDLAYDMNLSWGDWVFIFGYPKSIKQMTGGWVSKAPYKGNIAVDAVVRFGFSGGPVFAISEKQGTLSFAGVIKSVPRRKIEYLSHDGTLPAGYHLKQDDIESLLVKQEILVEYGTAYFVSPNTIRDFFRHSKAFLENDGINLPPKYYGR